MLGRPRSLRCSNTSSSSSVETSVLPKLALVILTSPLDDEWERQVVVEIQKTLWWFLYPLNTWGSSISVVNATFAAFSLYYAYYWMHDTIAINQLRAAGEYDVYDQTMSSIWMAASLLFFVLLVVLALVPLYLKAQCASLLKELNFKQIECFTIGSDGVIDKAAATSAALKVSLLVGSLRNDPRFGFRWRGPPPKLLLKVVSVGFALTALVPSALSVVDPYAAREAGSG